ncbi:homeobox-domain-containing protein [Backusella circina FSU 941]|nr:homeobox-domain-containing protein [Backusella circina FSU 941]
MKSTCVLPSLSDILMDHERPLSHSHSVLDIANLLSPPAEDEEENPFYDIKAKRKRASPSQLSILNRVFQQTYFPSTELRIELGKQLGMSPRTVQIWFQNKRQSIRTRERLMNRQQKKRSALHFQPNGIISPPISPSSAQHYHSTPPMKDMPLQLPSLRLPPPSSILMTPSSSVHSSPRSFDSLLFREY